MERQAGHVCARLWGHRSSIKRYAAAIRRHLIQSGYAWAASSYSTNYYDVRTGVEDTNSLALAFNAIAVQNGRPLAAPVRIYITDRSMGGHIAAAAVERETLATAVNKVELELPRFNGHFYRLVLKESR